MAKDAAFKHSNIYITIHKMIYLNVLCGLKFILPQHLLVLTEVQPHTLGPTLLIGWRDGGELAVPCLTAFVPAGDLKERGPLSNNALVWFLIKPYISYTILAIQRWFIGQYTKRIFFIEMLAIYWPKQTSA